jgi:hypothetical protein
MAVKRCLPWSPLGRGIGPGHGGAVPPARAARPRVLRVISPLHGVVFRGMKRNIAQAAETEANRTRTRPRRAHPVGAPPDSAAWVGAFVRPR